MTDKAAHVQAGIDPLVKKAIKQLWPNSLLGPKNLTELIVFIEEERECEAEYRRSQAERIITLEALEKDTSTKFFSEHEQRIAAESLLAEARKALEFYANRDSYRNRPLEEQRALNGDRDPTIAITGVARAPAGCALSDIQEDRQGDRARAILSRLNPGEKGDRRAAREGALVAADQHVVANEASSHHSSEHAARKAETTKGENDERT